MKTETPQKYYETDKPDLGAAIFAIIGTFIIGAVLIIPSFLGYVALWLGGKANLWVFDKEKECSLKK